MYIFKKLFFADKLHNSDDKIAPMPEITLKVLQMQSNHIWQFIATFRQYKNLQSDKTSKPKTNFSRLLLCYTKGSPVAEFLLYLKFIIGIQICIIAAYIHTFTYATGSKGEKKIIYIKKKKKGGGYESHAILFVLYYKFTKYFFPFK